MMRYVILALCVLALGSCGVSYISPVVEEGSADGTAVRVLPMTPEVVLQANRSPYRPKTLPAIFSVTSGGASTARAGAPLPDPVFEQSTAPSQLALRIPPAVDPGPYRIGIGDVVVLATPGGGSTVEELSGLLAAQNRRQGYTVQDDRSIAIPNVGRVQIAGRTIEEAEAELFQRLVENQIDPTFSLEVAEFNSQRVSIGGAVASPAVVPITLTPLFLEEAIAQSGGVTAPDLDYASVRIYRNGTIYQIPLNDLYGNANLPRIRLIDGDSVFVDTEYELSAAQAYFEQQITLTQLQQNNRTAALQELRLEVDLRQAELQEARDNYLTRVELGAVERDYVYITGEVNQQTRYPLPFEQKATLADALFEGGAGIPIETGDVSQIYVLRASTDPREFGAITAYNLDASNAASFAIATQFELRPDDVIFVAEQKITRWGRVIDQITPSLITTGVSAAAR